MSLEESWEKAINDRPAGSAQQPPTTPIADDVWDRALDAPTQLIRDPWSTFPPLLDRYGATKAAPFTGTELQGFRGASDRIASFYGPQLLTQESMRIQREYGEKAMQKTRGEAAPINMANVRVKFGSRPGEDEEEASSPLGTVSNPLTDVGLSFNESLGVKTFFADKRKMPDTAHARDLKCINRYHQYMTHCIPEDEIEEFNEEWAGNMLVRLTQSSIFSLPDEILGGTSEDYLQKTRENYKHAVAKAILDYVLMNPTERRRLELLNPPVDNATVLTPHPQRLTAVPHSWFEFVGEARDAFESSSTLCEPSLLQVLGLWQEFHDLLTVDIPEVTDSVKVITIDEFEAMQNNHRDEVKQTFKNRWHTAVAKAIRSNTLVNMALLESDAPAAQRNLKMTQSIFESLATLMVAQLRGVVTRSVQAYLELFQGYKLNVTKPDLLSTYTAEDMAKEGKTLQNSEAEELPDRVPIRINIKMVCAGATLVLEPQLNRIESVALHLLDEAVEVFNDTARIGPPSQIAHDAILKVVDLGESFVTEARQEIAAITKAGTDECTPLMEQYGKWMFLLGKAHADTVKEFLDKPQTLETHQEKLEMYTQYIEKIRNLSADVVHYRMLAVNTASAKQTLITKCEELIGHVVDVPGILHRIAMQTTTYNIELVDKYSHMDVKLRQPPENEDALVRFKAYLLESKRELIKMSKKVADVKANLFFLLDWHFLLGDNMKMYITVFGWPNKIQNAVKEAEGELKGRKEEFENKLRKSVEDFEQLLEKYAEEVQEVKKFGDLADVPQYKAQIEALEGKIADARVEKEVLNEEETKLEWPLSDFLTLENTATELEQFAEFWKTVYAWKEEQKGWMGSSLTSLDAEAMDKRVGGLRLEMVKVSKKFGDKFPHCRDAALRIKEDVENFKQHMPLIELLSTNGMRDRHFVQVSEIVGMPLRKEDHLKNMLLMDIGEHVEKLEEVSSVASKEYKMEQAMNKMEEDWKPMSFVTKLYRESGTYVLSGLDEIQQNLDDQIVKTQTMAGSAVAKAAFGPRVSAWEKRLTLLQDIIDVWLKVQSAWMYLEPIFSSEDIKKQMPKESNLFDAVDKVWREVMQKVSEDSGVMTVVDIPNMLGNLADAHDKLEEIQKGLNAYLETKRLYFPRFFFLSNDELLEILSETKDPLRVQPHLKKCFEGVNELDFADNLDIKAMVSPEKEKVPLKTTINPKDARGNVEIWLVQVEMEMLNTMKMVCSDSLTAYAQNPREKWILDWPGQLVLNCSQCFWTKEVEAVLEEQGNAGLTGYAEKCTKQLMDIVTLVRGDISKLARKTCSALVTIDVHARDTVVEIKNEGVSGGLDFGWLAQLRYYFEGAVLVCRMTNSQLMYGYEYLGNSGRLVITPLTDRCYRTLMGALHLNLGGAPEGPAGTGKTETTKDLAKAIAKQCVVFNCSDGLDYLAMGKFFKGLASSGAWACFDEFNRIDLEVLSVIAQQILTIQNAIAAKLETFEFEGSKLRLRADCAVFITMNPGYAGRSDLPDNLKALFRPVAMMVPDYGLISEIILYSNGYLIASDCARKIVATYKLCSEQLSSQCHYDYGMRAVISVLRAAGNLKRKAPDEDENKLMLRSIVDVNLPKFLSPDCPLFQGILTDLFPGVELPPTDYNDLNSGFDKLCKELNLQPVDAFYMKTQQLYEMILVRHGLMVVGEPDAAKTSMWKVLQGALTDMKERNLMGENTTHVHLMNPKSIAMGQLYGNFDPMSHEWTDGILANLYRDASKDQSDDRHWVLFDGPVDAIWIENMNTVLDDNKKLCLMSGEIIAMTGQMNMMFEPMDLAVASPATVSRVGIIFVEPHVMGWEPMLDSWLAEFPEHIEALKETAKHLFMWLLPPCLKYLRREVKEQSPTMDIMLAKGAMRIFRSLADELYDPEEYAKIEKNAPVWVEALFQMALVWSVGVTTDNDGRVKMNEFIQLAISGGIEEKYGEKHIYTTEQAMPPFELKMPLPTPEIPEDAEESFVPKTIYDWYFNKQTGKWTLWTDMNKGFKIQEGSEFQNTTIPTLDSARYQYIMKELVRHSYLMLFVGPTGTGKTIYAKQVLMYELPEEFSPIFIGFSAQTSANMTQGILDGKLDKRRKGVFGPPRGKKYTVLIDDLNMPKVETYGAQPPIELVRQCWDNGGWYDWDEKGTPWKSIEDLIFCAAMGPPGGGRSFVTPRLIHHFNQIAFTDLADDVMCGIYSTMLSYFFGVSDMAGPVLNSVDKIVTSTLRVYKGVLHNLRPTPSKSHYLFNLRDFARVIQGVVMATSVTCETYTSALRLFVHEAIRVFMDRLVNDEDRTWFNNNMKEIVRDVWDKDFDQVFQDCNHRNPGEPVDIESIRNLLWGNFMNEKRQYAELPTEQESQAQLTETMETFLAEYNEETTKPMKLVLFMFAVEHATRIARMLSLPGGNALLVGLGGSGRQSDCRLASHIAGCGVRQIELSKSYTMVEWHDDCKSILMQAGADDKPTTFLFTDSQIKYEGFVEDLNNMLNTGEVPNLFAVDEQAQMAEKLRKKYEAATGKKDASLAEYYAFFLERVKTNLHICLVFSPVGDAFRERIRMFPALVNCCTIDWFKPWPPDALETVAVKFLADVELDEKVRPSINEMCTTFHTEVMDLSTAYVNELRRYNYVTPTSYLQLINSFKQLLGKVRNDLKTKKNRYVNGLEKLADAASQVDVMKEELIALQPKLVIAQEETATMMTQVEKEKVEVVEPKKAIVQADEAAASKKAEEANALKESCEADLNEAMPALDAAVKALDTLKKDDITFLKQLKKPPAVIKLVMHSVCIMFGEKAKRKPDPDTGKMAEDWWEPSLKLVSDSNFLANLKAYDKDNIDPKRIDKIRKDFEPNPDFNPDAAKGASAAAEGVCKWVLAMSTYDRVAKVVAPKKAQLAEAEAEYSEVMVQLEGKRAELAEVLGKLKKLEDTLDDLVRKKETLEAQVQDCKDKLERAEKLIGGLGGEKTRWTEAAEALGVQYTMCTGDVLLSAAMVAYLGAFTLAFRERLAAPMTALIKEKKIPASDHISLVSTIGDPVEIREWNIQGLPTDNFSAENGIMVKGAARWPLCIDPQGQANKWIRNLEADNKLIIIKLNKDDDMRLLETAIQFGQPVLLENVGEELDPVIEPILLKQTFKQGGSLVIRLGEATLDYSLDFKFYITTKLRNPHYLPETQVKVTLLNFMITPAGLQDQVLGIVVALERPDLEEEKAKLILEAAANARQLKEVEDTILKVLSAEGNILEDATAIDVLSASKKLSNEINEKQEIAAATEKDIDAARQEYKGIAFSISVMYFAIADLANIEPMYQYSLPWFINLFKKSIQDSEKSSDLKARLEILYNFFLYSLYNNICRSLFEKDKVLFSLLLCQRLMESRGEVDAGVWRFLLTGGLGGVDDVNPCPEWLAQASWLEMVRMCRIEPFKGKDFMGKFKADPAPFQHIFDSETPQNEKLPAPWDTELNDMERCCILRVLRQDKLVPRLADFITNNLGQKYIEPPPFDLEKCYSDSRPDTPLIFVLTPGSDPTLTLLQFAATQEKSLENGLVKAISLGQGQGPKAEAMIKEGMEQGAYVLLQNCHLASSWMPKLEMVCDMFDPKSMHKEFRLWLTSYPSEQFPISILQNGVKMTNEPPKGLKANVIGSFNLTPICEPEFFDGCNKPLKWKKLLYNLCFFHAFIQERRAFGPIGWNIPYEFNESDLRMSVRQLQMFLNEYDETQFEALKYLTGHCNYGGRVTDDWDRRCLNTILESFYCEEGLVDGFEFSPSGDFKAPNGDYTREDVQEYTRNLPTVKPEVFGMHANADISKDKKEVDGLLSAMLLTQSSDGGGGGGGKGRDEVVSELAAEITEKIPKAIFDIEMVQRAWPITYEESMNTVIKQELIRYNRLLEVMFDTLKNISLAMKGLIVLSNELDNMATQMYNNQTPTLWKARSYPSLKPLAAYVEDFVEKMAFFNNWIEKGQPNVFWLTGIFFTHALLTGTLQNYARKKNMPIDLVVFDFEIMSTDDENHFDSQPEDGMYVRGCFLEGAIWNYDIAELDESKPKVLYGVCPIMWFKPSHKDHLTTYDHYRCPMYRTDDRRGTLATTGHSTNFVMAVRLPTSKPSAHWIKRGTALLTTLRD